MDTVNLKQLAQILKLSVSTVSKAFSDSYEISPETKARILAMAKELNYQPNAFASGLRTQKTKTIAVIVPEIANNFFSLSIKGIESVAQAHGYHVLIYLSHEDPLKEKEFARLLLNGRVDGILMSLSGGTEDFAHLEELERKETPLIFFDRVFESSTRSMVTTNDFESGQKATRHLLENDCRKIMHLTYSNGTSISRLRALGFTEAMKQAGIKPLPYLQLLPNRPVDYYREAIGKALKKYNPDGVFSAYEKLAMLTYECCQEKGISIPQDLKVVTFSNLEIASLLCPSLTTITQPAYEIGKTAASILFEELRGKNKTKKRHIVIDAALHIRNSSKSKDNT